MEADWSAEIGPELPCIEGSWVGFVDLQAEPSAADTILEATKHPALRAALLKLNAPDSLVSTTKCDTWPLSEDNIDPYEFGASADQSRAGFASYIDVLERDAALFASFGFHEQKARELTARLRALDLRQGRVDIVLRAAVLKGQSGFGLTLYVAGCGPDEVAAYGAWEQLLAAAAAATIATALRPRARASSSIG
jgi:hypothetical protein